MFNNTVVIKAIFTVIILVDSLSLYAVDLKSVLNDVIDNHPEILQKRQELSAAEHELTIVRSGFLPKIDVRSSVAKERANTQMTGFNNRDFSTLNSNIVLTQNLFSGFSTSSDMAAKRYNIETKSYELTEKMNDISLRMIKSYLDVAKASELLDIERDNVKAHEEIYRKITLKMESGSGRISDHKEVLAKLALSYVNTLTQDNNYNDASTMLHTVIGHYLNPREIEKPTIITAAIPCSLDEAMREAAEKNPAILVSRSEIESAKKAHSLEQSNYYPKVDAELNSRTYDNANGTGNTDKTAAAMVTLSYNLYNGGSDEARVKRSLSQTYNAIEHFRFVQRDVTEKMAMAYNAYTVFNRQKPFLEVYRDASLDKTHFYEEEFDLGRRSLIDLLESENEYSTARRKAVENEYDRLYSFYRVLAAKNELVSYFHIETGGNSSKNYPLFENIKSEINSENAPSVGMYPPIIPIMVPIEKDISPIQESNFSAGSVKEINPKKGYVQYLKAARKGDHPSQCMMVRLYEEGIGTKKNSEKALYWKQRCTQTPKDKPSLESGDKTKSLDERLKELGIILNGLKK